MRALLLRSLLALLLALGAVLPGTAASAHTSLVGTDPAQGAELSELDQVSLEFSGAVLDLGTTLALVQGDERITLDPTFPTETTVVAEVPELADGAWSLMYRVVAEDGHPLEGQVDFTIVGSTPGPAESTTTDAGATPETSPSAQPTPVSTASPSPSPSASAEPADEAGTGGWVRIAGAAILAAVAAGVILWLRRRDSGTGARSDADTPHGEA